MKIKKVIVVFEVGIAQFDEFIDSLNKWEEDTPCYTMEITHIEEMEV